MNHSAVSDYLTEAAQMIPKTQPRNYSRRNHYARKHIWRVPSRLFLQPAGLVACACWNSHTTYGWQKSGFLIVIITAFMCISLFLPYCVAIGRQAMPAFLPFISQAGGSPPMNGLFAISLIIMAFIGVFPFVLLYENINHRNINESKHIRMINSIALAIILVCCLGCVVTAANPVGFTDLPNKFDWIVSVLFEHGLGACMILIGTAFYQFGLTRIWFLLPDATKTAKYIKLALSVGFIVLFFTSVKPMPDHLYEELGPEPFNIQLLKNTTYDLPLVFTTSYLICAICEWTVCIFTILNFITMYKDLQKVSFHVVLRHKSCFTDTLEPAPCISLKTLS